MSRPELAFTPADAAPVFAALGDPTRLALISRLDDGTPRSISQLADGMPLTRQGVSKHLRVLELAGIVAGRRVGRESRFVLQPDKISAAETYLARAARQWDASLSRLRTLIEDN